MKITAVAVEDLKSKGLELLPTKMNMKIERNAIPDTYGECIGRYDKSTEKYESFFKKDEEAGNTKYFEEYKYKCNLVEKHRNVIDRSEGLKEKQVIDYYVMYDIKESSKTRPTEIEDHVDHGICMNGNHKCEYELLFACEGWTRRVVVEYTSNNIPMYEFIGELEDDVNEILEGESDESNPFKNVLIDRNGWFEVLMFDDIGTPNYVEVDHASELMDLLVSVRLLSCEFIEKSQLNLSEGE